MIYNLKNLLQMATESGPIPMSTAILALAIEICATRRELTRFINETTRISSHVPVGGSNPYPDDL